MSAERIAELHEWLKPQCSRLLYGQCSTLRCLKRGGYVRPGPVDYNIATCEPYEIEAEIAKAADVRQFIEAQRDMAVFKFREAESEITRLSNPDALHHVAKLTGEWAEIVRGLQAEVGRKDAALRQIINDARPERAGLPKVLLERILYFATEALSPVSPEGKSE
jgi:hypothetical protein